MRNLQKHVKIISLAVILLMVAVAAPLSAQNGARVFVSPTTGGTRAEQTYFNSNLPAAVQQTGYRLADSREDSDLYITSNLEYSDDFQLQTVVVTLYDTNTDELISTNAMGYEQPDDMDQWNMYLIYELMASAPFIERTDTETAPVVVSLSLFERLFGETPYYWLYLGFRVGPSMRYYSPMKLTNNTGITFEMGPQAMVQILPFLGVQTGILFTMDNVPAFGTTKNNKLTTSDFNYKSTSMMIPVVVMATFRPDQWLFAPLGGIYFNIPLGKMESEGKLDSPTGTSSYGWESKEKWMGLGWTAGFEVGRRVGPGTLFFDVRFSADFGDTVWKGENKKGLYQRSGTTLSLGYEFGLLQKK